MDHTATPDVVFTRELPGNAAATLVVYHDPQALGSDTPGAHNAWYLPALQSLRGGASVAGATTLLLGPPGQCVVAAPTGPLTREYDDVRRYGDAVGAGMRHLLAHRVLCENATVALVLQSPPAGMPEDVYDEHPLVCALSALAELHVLPEVSAAVNYAPAACAHVGAVRRVSRLVVVTEAPCRPDNAEVAMAIEEGRRLARDIGGSDSERMTPAAAADAIAAFFALRGESHGGRVTVDVLSDDAAIAREYPLLHAVARASLHVARHHPRIVRLTYVSADAPPDGLEIDAVGKGVCFDTGGADIKAGGAMVGMSRDKAGAAALAGLVAVAARLRPPRLRALRVALAFVRNSVGSDAYVCDEVIRSRANVRVRIGNTDAEGRMAMADLLAEAAQRTAACAARDARPTRLVFTCATLTGHVVRAYGPYAAALDNGQARALGVASALVRAGDAVGDPFEASRIRREDYAFVAPTSVREDVVQANSLPSTLTARGHQYPAAFLAIASGIAAMDRPPAYTHVDIAGSAEETPGPLGRLTGSPIPAMARAFFL